MTQDKISEAGLGTKAMRALAEVSFAIGWIQGMADNGHGSASEVAESGSIALLELENALFHPRFGMVEVNE